MHIGSPFDNPRRYGPRSPYAEASAERWCNGCIARTALEGGEFPERGSSGVEEVEEVEEP